MSELNLNAGMKGTFIFIIFFMWAGFFACAQEVSGLDSAIHHLAGEKNPKKMVREMKGIIKEFHLDKIKDAETFDVLYGTVAVNAAVNRCFKQFEKYIGFMQNKFNQTSFLNMAASKLLQDSIDAVYANKIARRTLTLFQSFKNDSTAKPKDFSKQDWDRFMNFAQYPYYDTYAHSLFALKKYDEALEYQKMAFDGNPEEGLPASVERYAALLAMTGKSNEAKKLLLKMAGMGKLSKGMKEQLQNLYIQEYGSDENLAAYLDSLQANVQATLIPALKQKMLDQKAPAFSLRDIHGNLVKLSDFTGRIVVLDLWATWCLPCIASFPAMQRIEKKHPEITFLFIAVEEKEENPLPTVKKFIEKRNYDFKVLIDEPIAPGSPQFKITSAYQPNGIPAKYIIDKSGVLRFKTSGFDTDTELVNELEAMFSIVETL